MTPRVVRTVEELEGLPEGKDLILAADGSVYRRSPFWERHFKPVWERFVSPGDEDVRLNAEDVPLPATVLAPPSVTAEQVNVSAQRFYEASGLVIRHTDKPKVVAGMRAALTALGFEVVDGE